MNRYPSLTAEHPDQAALYAEQNRQHEISKRRAAASATLNELIRNVGARYAECTLASFAADLPEQQRAIEVLRKFIVDLDDHLKQGEGLLLFGPPGTGKDHLMVAVAREAISRGASLHWVNGLEFYASVRDSIGDDRSETSIVRQLSQPDVLCISDPVPPIVVGNDRSRGALSEFQAATVFRVIDRRYRERKATWATLNVATARELEERIGEPIVDRLRHGATSVPCQWPSYRKAR